MHNDVESRVQKLEQEQARHQQRLVDGERRFAEILAAISASNAETILLRVAISELRTTIQENAKRECPDPGACIKLQGEMVEVKADLGSLKDSRTTVMGGWKALALVGGFAVALVGATAAITTLIKDAFEALKP